FRRRLLSGIIFVELVNAAETIRFIFDATEKQGRESEDQWLPKPKIAGAGGNTPHGCESYLPHPDPVKFIACNFNSLAFKFPNEHLASSNLVDVDLVRRA